MKLIIALALAAILTGCTSTNNQQVADGIIEILVISYQPGSYAGNKVANTKDQVEHQIRSNSGDSRIGRTIAAQSAPAARQAVGNASQTMLILLSNGIIDLNNLDHH